jgi:hypothetical protein
MYPSPTHKLLYVFRKLQNPKKVTSTKPTTAT